jgi:hypothetical protein
MKHRRITRKRNLLAVGAMSALALGALSVAPSAGAAGASLPETTSQPSVLGVPGVRTEDTHEWAGYVATGGGKPFTYVAAEFTVAAVNCGVTPHLSWTSQWVGLDGWHGKTVEQVGVKSECGGDRDLPPNAAHYYAWWEMYPDPVRVLEPVNAGDTVEAQVYEISPGEYALSLQDVTKGGGEAGEVEFCHACKNASAEVISEGYNEDDWKGPADFGRESFSDISLGEYTDLIGNFSSTIWTNIAAIQDQENSHGDLVVDADPTPLSAGGTAFSVVWHSDK